MKRMISGCAILVFLALLNPTSPVSAAEPRAAMDTLKIGDEAPSFVMRNLATGDVVYLRDYVGKTLRNPWIKKERQVTVLSFWATWCQPCKTEIPILTKLAGQFTNQPVKFFLVNTLEKGDQTEDSVLATCRARGYTLTCLIDPAERYALKYSVRGLPVLVVIDKFGIVRKINHGYHENFQIELEKVLKDLMKEDETVKK